LSFDLSIYLNIFWQCESIAILQLYLNIHKLIINNKIQNKNT
jgi:hypothetical protein